MAENANLGGTHFEFEENQVQGREKGAVKWKPKTELKLNSVIEKEINLSFAEKWSEFECHRIHESFIYLYQWKLKQEAKREGH